MIEDVQKYNAEAFLLGHESICNLDENHSIYWGFVSPQTLTLELYLYVSCINDLPVDLEIM